MRSDRMMMLAGGILLTATACVPVDRGFGEALKYDMAIQTIDPDPVYPEGSAEPGSNGEKGQKAMERYRKGTTKPVRQDSASGGGASGAGGGSTPGS